MIITLVHNYDHMFRKFFDHSSNDFLIFTIVAR
jgi:hypothetical protein